MRIPMITGLALLAGSTFALPAALAQTDPSTQRLIEQLRPRDPGSLGDVRGIRPPSARPPAESAAPATPTVTLTPTPAPGAATTQPPAATAPQPGPVQAPPPMATTRPAPPPPPRETTAPEGVPAVSLTVNFATGSAQLTPQARAQLDRLGAALSSPDLAPFRFRIEGHTDTTGSAALNQRLSEERAAAVAAYLQQRWGIAPGRLETVGFGQTQLLVQTPDNTAEARNRRVQVLNIGS